MPGASVLCAVVWLVVTVYIEILLFRVLVGSVHATVLGLSVLQRSCPPRPAPPGAG